MHIAKVTNTWGKYTESAENQKSKKNLQFKILHSYLVDFIATTEAMIAHYHNTKSKGRKKK